MESRQDRRALLSAMGAAAAGVALATAPGYAQTKASAPAKAAGAPPRGKFTPARHREDAWLDEAPGKHRTIIDSATAPGAANALLYAGNLFTANKSGYGLNDGDLAIVVCLRHFATVFAFNDAMWAKHGKTFAAIASIGDKAAAAPTTNPHLQDANMGLPIPGISPLAKRGVQFAICDMATHFFASQIATATNGDAAAIYKELVANAVPNSHFVAAGVVGTTRAQEYGYSLLVAG